MRPDAWRMKQDTGTCARPSEPGIASEERSPQTSAFMETESVTEQPGLLFRRIAIVGSGAIGGFYGGMLAARTGAEVHFLFRSDYDAVRQDGLRIIQHDGETLRLHPVRAHRETESIGPVDLVVVALKSTSNEALPGLLGPLVGPATVLLTLQNGLGNVEFLSRLFPGRAILGGLCFIALNRLEPGLIRNFFEGRLSLGGGPGASEAVTERAVELFRRAGIRASAAPSLEEALWRKLVWNVPFNGLGIAGGDRTTKDVLALPELEALARRLMGEVQAAAATQGVAIPDAFLEKQIETTRPMGAYAPSSLIDYRQGRPIEIEAIWGEPLRRAAGAGLELPYLETLYALLKGIASRPIPGHG